MRKIKLKSNDGFSLVELIVYIGMLSMIIMVSTSFLVMAIGASKQNRIVTEVEQQGAQLMQIITQSIYNAQAVNFPVAGTGDGQLSLDTSGSGFDPTIFNIIEGVAYVTEGTEPSMALTSSRVQVLDMNFFNLSAVDTPGIVRIHFMVNAVDPARNYSKIFDSSAALR